MPTAESKYAEFLLVFVIAILITMPLAADNTLNVEVEADSLQIDHKNKSASFKGNVHATYGAIKFSCDVMSVTYNENGMVTSLKAEGKVRVQRGDALGMAAKATLDVGQNLLVLVGNPILLQGPHRLEGERVTVHLASGKVDVKHARGKFKMGVGVKK